ncbi:hypothetical protein GT347_08755 [Xylophilus rhododendri]|uniref:Uncharacterized protein n=1 Tax=Xylophilus rhododendri TaxID=2697032 RepID=A0A857J2T7_9BURK|nr:hypothetical protein [Xylophilus rhododendri]QHI98076.1 hypothetical protein GT347_08755 [Xylophilus rhododendri]
MSLKSLLQVLDAPLAIVVGGVAAVLIVLQLGALGMLVQSQVDRAAQREAGVREQRMARMQCLGAQGRESFAACNLQADSARGVQPQVQSVAMR